ncbi:neutrophil collagenase [Ranunculus cassubicifolius]
MTFLICSLVISSLVFLPILFAQTPPYVSNKNPNPFGFLNHLQGCHKGETIKGVHDLKSYLKKYGYLNYDQSGNTHANDDEFDEFLESGIKTYQTNYHLKITGTLDAETVETMSMPRCGVADIINGTTRMGPGKAKRNPTSLHTVSHYAFTPGSPRWTHLTYAFDTSANRTILAPVFLAAFAKWSAVSIFTFEEIQDYNASDIVIGVHTGDHGDGDPFDGPGGTLAHAYPPTDGRLHFDGDERWSIVPANGTFDLESVALHEIGHILGLDHSSIEGAIMFARIPIGVRKGLHEDDVQGIRALYTM